MDFPVSQSLSNAHRALWLTCGKSGVLTDKVLHILRGLPNFRAPEFLGTLKMLPYLPKSILMVRRKSFVSLDFFAKGLAGASSEPFRRFLVIVVYKHGNMYNVCDLSMFLRNFFLCWARWTFCSVVCVGSLIGIWWMCCSYARIQTWLHVRLDFCIQNAASGSWAEISK